MEVEHYIENRQSTLKIAYASDIHFEFEIQPPNWLPVLPDAPDIFILAGDINIGDKAIESVLRISRALPNTNIIFVAGNHEFYHNHHELLLNKYRNALAHNERVHFLENESITIKGVTFLGCTLWTGFDALPEFPLRISMNDAALSIADFRLIKTEASQNGSCNMTPDKMRELYQESRYWLASQMKKNNPERTVVVTHFPPHSSCEHALIKRDVLTNYFLASCDDLIEKHQPAAWIYGHNHWSDIKKLGNTTIASNQLGYSQERDYLPKFNYEIFEIVIDE